MAFVRRVVEENLTPELLRDLHKLQEDYRQVCDQDTSDFMKMWLQAPEAAKEFFNLYFPAMSVTRGRITGRIVELARLKIAELAGNSV
jgi:hypothetical protein